MKKSVFALVWCVVLGWAFAEENPPFTMGLWIEAASNNTFLTRDIATGEKEGYEFDRAALYTKANWWMWAEITPRFQLDAEIGLWEKDFALYQANSFGGNIPETTWADGFHGLASALFAPIPGLNGQNVGSFNKLGFSVITPYVISRFGYGELKAGGMGAFTGIFNVIDRWDNVGRGYTELTLGQTIAQIGDSIHLNALLGLSRMRTEYGVYSMIQAGLFEKAKVSATFTSTSNEPELFRYNEQNENAFSLYGSYAIMENLQAAIHGLGSFENGSENGAVAFAGAAALKGAWGLYEGDLVLSLAEKNAKTVWGDDETVSPDSLSAALVQWFTVLDSLRLGLDTNVTAYNIKDMGQGLLNIRNQPMLDFNLKQLTALDIPLSLYGAARLDRIATADDPDQSWAFCFEEAGLEISLADMPFLKKLVFDYAVLAEYGDWDVSDGYSLDIFYNSIMLSGDITDSLSATLGSVLRINTGGGGGWQQ
ncbi:MAG: hypothetical protein LBD48_03135 [Treponema sp.]|jgi:hypothetical protein|nr:hypothetical protein [Treponema sp.]